MQHGSVNAWQPIFLFNRQGKVHDFVSIARTSYRHATGRWHHVGMNPNRPEDWNDTVAIDEADTSPLALLPGPVFAVGEAKPYPPEQLPWWRWVMGGLRAGFLRSPEVGHAQPGHWQVLWVSLLGSALLLALARLEVNGPAVFDWRAWLVPWWMTLVALWGAWFALPQASFAEEDHDPYHLHGLASWFALSTWVSVPAQLLLQLLSIAVVRDWLHWQSPAASWLYWVLYIGLTGWTVVAVVRLTARFAGPRSRLVLFALLLGGLCALAIWQFPDRPWAPDESALEAQTPQAPQLHLTQEVFEAQQALWATAAAGLQPQRDDAVDVYGLVFSPYAEEEVFRRESQMVADVLSQRFDAEGRVLQLVNHPETAQTLLWATPLNLRRAIDLIAAKMDREHDVLVVYLTSHGAQDFQLAASHWPLEVAPINAGLLRRNLDEAGIRNRVIAVSACYSGGWIEPLASDDTLVMTASDATHTSFGCGSQSDLTFFGRAVFAEQLRQTHSFAQAFSQALPVIARREVAAGKDDGPSNPQMRLGARIGVVLSELQQRLDKR
jgi:hypothetical protein